MDCRYSKNNVYPINPSFTIYKWGLRGSKLFRCVFVMCNVFFFFVVFFLSGLMQEVVKMYNSGNSAVDVLATL